MDENGGPRRPFAGDGAIALAKADDNSAVLLSTLALARRVERAEIDFCALAAGHESSGDALTLDAGGGRAVFGRLGSPLNKVLGLGLGAHASDADLVAIEQFYAAHRSAIAIELCPLAQADLPVRLSARGYTVQAFESQLACELAAVDRATMAAREPTIHVTRADDDQQWLEAVAEGFAVAEEADRPPAGEAVATMSAMMRAFLHPAISRYVALADGAAAGGGAAYEVDRVVGIFGTSTRLAFRRRGVQRAIVQHAIADAPAATLAIATTAPGSASQRTFERLGFQLLYTRAIFSRGA